MNGQAYKKEKASAGTEAKYNTGRISKGTARR